MKSYELTERGKIVVAVIIVLLLLTLSGILMIKAGANRALRNSLEKPLTTAQSPPATETDHPTKDSPPPNGGGFNPPDITDPSHGANTEDPNDPNMIDDLTDNGSEFGEEDLQENVNGLNEIKNGHEEPNSDLTGAKISSGVFTFSLSPDNQYELDNETKLMLEKFMGLRDDAPRSKIAVETSITSDAGLSKLLSVIKLALAEYGISEKQIVHIMLPITALEDRIEVKMYYVTSSNK